MVPGLGLFPLLLSKSQAISEPDILFLLRFQSIRYDKNPFMSQHFIRQHPRVGYRIANYLNGCYPDNYRITDIFRYPVHLNNIGYTISWGE